MALSYVSSAGNATAGASTTVTTGSLADGLVVYALVFSGSSGSGNITSPAGWTELLQYTHADTYRTALFRLVTSSAPTTHAFGRTSSNYIGASLWWFSGADTTTPEDATRTTNEGTGSTITYPAITTVTDNAFVIASYTDAGGNGTSDPTGYTGIGNDSSTVCHGAYVNKATAGSETPGTTTSSGGSWVAVTFAIRPAAGAAAGQPTMDRWGGTPGMTPGAKLFGRRW